jgi:NUMOD1 domain
MIICKALLKYGYSNFKLEILEYCDVNNVRAREQYYLDTLKPVYNILKIAGTSLGFKHSEESKKKINKHLEKLNADKGIKVEITDIKNNTITVFDSVRKAAKTIGCDKSSIFYQEKRLVKDKLKPKLLKKRYIVKIIR